MLSHKKKIFIAVILFVLQLALLTFGSYKLLNFTVRGIIIKNIDELAEHDMKNIMSYVDLRLENVEALFRGLKNSGSQSLEELQKELHGRSVSGSFDHLYLIDGEGKLYSDSYAVHSREDNPFLQYFDRGSDRFVYRYILNEDNDEVDKESLIYGIEMPPTKIGDTTFTKMVALNDIAKIQSKMHISSYGGRGYSSIINRDGYFIVNVDDTPKPSVVQNFFSVFDDGSDADIEEEELRSKINGKEDVSFTYTKEDGDRRFISVKPIENSNWLLVNSVDDEVFAEQTRTFMYITMAVVIALLIIVSIIFIIYFVLNKKIKKLYFSVVDGMYNRQYYDDKLKKERVHAFAVCDLDHLKQINDKYGHLAGDHAIKAAATVIMQNVCEKGYAVRYGGDEFIIAIKQRISKEDFVEMLNCIVMGVHEAAMQRFPDISLSASVGGYYGEGICDELFPLADELLYKAKKDRNMAVTNVE